MRTVTLGRTGLEVSRIAMGGIPLQRPSIDEAVRIVHRALDLGVNFFDTAAGYGVSEERFGKALAGRRSGVVIATKSGRRTKEEAAAEIERSLKRLQTDYIDVWQFHNIADPGTMAKVLGSGGAMEAAQEALKAGKIRHIGLSSHNINTAIKAVKSGHFETIQFPFNYVTHEPADELIPLAAEKGVGFIGMKPFAGGMLGRADLSIKYVLQFDSVIPDPGIETIEEIEEIAALVDSGDWELSPAELAEIEARRDELGTQFCRQCGYCQPCPQGIPISMAMIVEVMWKLWPRNTFLEWLEGVIEKARTCLKCGVCESRCPYDLPIRERLEQSIAFFDRVVAEA